ncbi:hypothetical protein AAFP30_17615 [Gordonia sp. CPCC 205515]|uniref:hypothetical protein n=1 Tax=Gordonia sp. CPCC 205515 TaxID=3140791 RepID=UPI003AF3F29E
MIPHRTPRPSTVFGISPDEVAALVRIWQEQARVIDGLDFAGLAALPVSASRVVAALRATASPARTATAAVGGRLTSIAAAVAVFSARSVAEDHAAARRLAELPDR